MLEVSNLECVRGDRRLFADMSFSVKPGELLHVQGPNGSGKTSLLRMVCGLVVPVQGDIFWGGENIRTLREDYFRDITYLGHLRGIKEDLTALENLRILMGLAGQEGGADADESTVVAALGKMGLAGREDLPAKVLSQGQKRRVALARLLLCKTRLWILDEPFTALDVTAIAVVQALLSQHLHNGGMIILTTHQDLDVLSKVSSAGAVQRLHLKDVSINSIKPPGQGENTQKSGVYAE